MIRSRLMLAGIVALAVVAVLAVALLFVPLVGAGSLLLGPPDPAGAQSTLDLYLKQIEADDDTGAYAMLCDSVRHEVTGNDFEAAVLDAPRPRSHKILDATVITDDEVRVGVRLDGDRPQDIRVTSIELWHRDGTWWICGRPYL